MSAASNNIDGNITKKIKSEFGEKPIRIVFLNAADAKLEKYPDYQKILKWKIIRRNGFLRKKLKSNYCNLYKKGFLI
jgi:hypothetical protein